jgi:oligoendopeptidase F
MLDRLRWKGYLRIGVGLLLLGVLCGGRPCAAQGAGEVPERSAIEGKYKWDLTALYATDAAWEADVDVLEGMIPRLKTFEGKISKSSADLLAYFKTVEEASKKLDNTFSYAMQSYDTDTRDQKYTGYKERITIVATKFGEALSWFSPELVSIPDETFQRWYKETPGLAMYRQFIDNQLRTRKHTLSPEEERILALSGGIATAPASASTALRNSDIKFRTIKDEEGNDVEVSEGRFIMLLESSDPRVRRDAALTLLLTYADFKNTAAALMTGNIQKDIFYARARGYQSALHASLDQDNVDTTVFLNLIATVKKNAGTLQRYCDLRRRALGQDSLHLYDMFAPLIPETRQEVPYDKAVAAMRTAMAPLGQEYVAAMMDGLNSGWVDVYENKGKRAGAYSTSTYLSHPYLFLNYNNTMDDMFAFVHEMGHAMHSWYSYKTQPYIYGDYTLFVAEVGSTFDEALLMDDLLKKEKDPAKKLYLVNQWIDQIRGTLVTQVMFADYEHRMHRAMEMGEPLTAESLSQMYVDTMKDYYGNSVAVDPEYGFTWIRIPHFYRNYYVYKYATAYAASQALSQKVLKGKGKERDAAREAYIRFLSGGSSKYPLDLLRDAGVDLATPAPVDATMLKFAELVDEMERLLKETGKI